MAGTSFADTQSHHSVLTYRAYGSHMAFSGPANTRIEPKGIKTAIIFPDLLPDLVLQSGSIDGRFRPDFFLSGVAGFNTRRCISCYLASIRAINTLSDRKYMGR